MCYKLREKCIKWQKSQWSGSSGLMAPHCAVSEGLRRPHGLAERKPSLRCCRHPGQATGPALQRRMDTLGSILA